MDELEIFCENIRKLRRHSRLTQKQMAEIMGISVYGIRQLEKGMLTSRITWCTLRRLHKYFGYPYHAFFCVIALSEPTAEDEALHGCLHDETRDLQNP